MFPIFFIFASIALQIALLVFSRHIDRQRSNHSANRTKDESFESTKAQPRHLSVTGLALHVPRVLPFDSSQQSIPEWSGQAEWQPYSHGMNLLAMMDDPLCQIWSMPVAGDRMHLMNFDLPEIDHGINLAGADLFHSHHSFETEVHDPLHEIWLQIGDAGSSHMIESSEIFHAQDDGHFQSHDDGHLNSQNDHHHHSHDLMGHEHEQHSHHHEQDLSLEHSDFQSHEDGFSSHDHHDSFGHDQFGDSFGSMWDN